jgi:glycosyltransferase involved in cell wall biosynthesis
MVTETTYPFLSDPTPVTLQHWPDDVPPLVSISCATYMHESFIRDAIEGFLMQQTTFKVEIMIYDDASADQTAAIVREYEKKFPQLIKPTYQTENQFFKIPKTSKYIKIH